MSVETIVGVKGQRIQDGPMGTLMHDIAITVGEYLDSDETSKYAHRLADLALDLSHLVVDLMEELGMVDPNKVL